MQGIAQVAKTEVPTDAKYELEDGKLMLSIYTSAKGLDTAAEDNSFNEYGGDATATDWAPNKEVFTDLKHIARSAQYHTLLSMTKMTLPAIIQKGSAQGTVFSVKEKIRNGKPVFEVMTVQGNTCSADKRVRLLLAKIAVAKATANMRCLFIIFQLRLFTAWVICKPFVVTPPACLWP